MTCSSQFIPKPISSASIPLSLLSNMATNQSSPMCWYSLNLCLRRNGTAVFTSVVARVIPFGWNFSAAAATLLRSTSLLQTLKDKAHDSKCQVIDYMAKTSQHKLHKFVFDTSGKESFEDMSIFAEKWPIHLWTALQNWKIGW